MPCCFSREEGAGIAPLPTLSTDGLCLQMQRMPTISHCRWLTFGTVGTPTHTARPKQPTQSWRQEVTFPWSTGAMGRRLWSLASLVSLLAPGQRWACRRSGKWRQWGEVKEKNVRRPTLENPRPFNKTKFSVLYQIGVLLKGYTCVRAYAFLSVPVLKEVLLHLWC